MLDKNAKIGICIKKINVYLFQNIHLVEILRMLMVVQAM